MKLKAEIWKTLKTSRMWRSNVLKWHDYVKLGTFYDLTSLVHGETHSERHFSMDYSTFEARWLGQTFSQGLQMFGCFSKSNKIEDNKV
jgi:hypothetical protein